jgi:hypothetical protein
VFEITKRYWVDCPEKKNRLLQVVEIKPLEVNQDNPQRKIKRRNE